MLKILNFGEKDVQLEHSLLYMIKNNMYFCKNLMLIQIRKQLTKNTYKLLLTTN